MKPAMPPFASAFGPLKRGEDGRVEIGFRGLKCIPRVSSLVFELELEDCCLKEECDPGVDAAVRELCSLAEPWTDVERRLQAAVRRAQESAAARRLPLDLGGLASRLGADGFDVKLCNALGGGSGGECLRNLRHSFLTVTPPPGAGGGGRLIVDLYFAEQFEIATPNARYAALLDALPGAFVGTEERAAALVEFLCREIGAAFRAQGVTLPPWRQAESMLSKWRPRRSVEHDVPSPVPSPASCGATGPRAGGDLLGRPPARALFA